jgi:hypothetical protein
MQVAFRDRRIANLEAGYERPFSAARLGNLEADATAICGAAVFLVALCVATACEISKHLKKVGVTPSDTKKFFSRSLALLRHVCSFLIF